MGDNDSDYESSNSVRPFWGTLKVVLGNLVKNLFPIAATYPNLVPIKGDDFTFSDKCL